LSFYSAAEGKLQINGEDGAPEPKEVLLTEFSKARNTSYFAKTNTELIEIPEDSSSVYLGKAGAILTIYAAQGKELFTNGSFENGLWATAVGDCNNYDKEGLVQMSLSSVTTHGSSSLALSATRHTACTSKNIGTFLPGKYVLTFNAKSAAPTQAIFRLEQSPLAGTASSSAFSGQAALEKDVWNFEHQALDSLKDFLKLFQ
jgi:hypothetical protein